METVLFVDDEADVLNAIERLFLDSQVRCRRAAGGREALAILRQEEVAVLVSDNLMPDMRGVELLTRAGEISPNTIRVLMTGCADLPTAIEAINRCEIFRFVMKPWKNEEFLQVVQDGLTRHRLIRHLSGRDEATLLSLAQMIELKDAYTKGHCERVADYALAIADSLGLAPVVREEIRFGAWLHDCGKIGVPESILNSPGPLAAGEFEVVKNHSSWGAEVARQARLSSTVVNIILRHHEHFDGGGYPGGLQGAEIPLEARIAAIADVWDALTTDRPYQSAQPAAEAMETLAGLRGTLLDPELTDRFLAWLRMKA